MTLVFTLSAVELYYLWFLIFHISADSTFGNGYRLPPPEIRDIVDAPPLPTLSLSPHRDKILFLKRRSLPPLADLARPEEKLAGVRIDGKCNSRSRMWVTTHLLDLLTIFFFLIQLRWWLCIWMFSLLLPKNLNTLISRSYYTGIGIHQIMDDGTLGPEKEIYGLPSGAKINFVTW